MQKKLYLFVITGVLAFLGVSSTSQAGAVWNSSEKRTIKLLETRIIELEKYIASQKLSESQKISITIPYIVEAKEEYGNKGECGSGKFRQLDIRGTAALMTAGNYRLHTCQISFKINK